jgi:hypothetical protein
MKRTLAILAIVLLSAGVLLLAIGGTQSSAVKTCREDAQRFAQENASYQAEYDSLFGATSLAQRPMM